MVPKVRSCRVVSSHLLRSPEVVLGAQVQPLPRDPRALLAVTHVPLGSIEARADQDELWVERSEGGQEPPLNGLWERADCGAVDDMGRYERRGGSKTTISMTTPASA